MRKDVFVKLLKTLTQFDHVKLRKVVKNFSYLVNKESDNRKVVKNFSNYLNLNRIGG